MPFHKKFPLTLAKRALSIAATFGCTLLDLDHLARQTLGNRDLQRELLDLFLTQSGEQLERLQRSGDDRERQEAAHMIIGSAKAIGAFDIARIASRIERGGETVEAEIAALASALQETRAFILAMRET